MSLDRRETRCPHDSAVQQTAGVMLFCTGPLSGPVFSTASGFQMFTHTTPGKSDEITSLEDIYSTVHVVEKKQTTKLIADLQKTII